jgi:hypothetical protein
MDSFRKLAHEQPFGPNGRTRLGFAMDTMFVQPKVVKEAFNEAREQGVQLITSHVTRVSMMDSEFIHAFPIFVALLPMSCFLTHFTPH